MGPSQCCPESVGQRGALRRLGFQFVRKRSCQRWARQSHTCRPFHTYRSRHRCHGRRQHELGREQCWCRTIGGARRRCLHWHWPAKRIQHQVGCFILPWAGEQHLLPCIAPPLFGILQPSCRDRLGPANVVHFQRRTRGHQCIDSPDPSCKALGNSARACTSSGHPVAIGHGSLSAAVQPAPVRDNKGLVNKHAVIRHFAVRRRLRRIVAVATKQCTLVMRITRAMPRIHDRRHHN